VLFVRYKDFFLYIQSVHSFCSIIYEYFYAIKLNKTQCTQIFAELSIVRNKLKSRIEHKYFGTNISQSLSNLGVEERKNFEKVALNRYERSLKYLEKWFAFENNIFQKLDVLNLSSILLSIMNRFLILWTL
jgi:hypothetical protein